MNKNGQNGEYFWTLLWAYAKKPLYRALLCAAVGFGIPFLVRTSTGGYYSSDDFSIRILFFVSEAALLLFFPSLVMLIKSIMDAQNDPDRKIVYAMVESAEKKTDSIIDCYTLVCRGDDGVVYRPLCYHTRCPDLIGTLVPLKVSRYVPGCVEVDTDMIVWDLDPAAVKPEPYVPTPSAPSDYGPVTWTWDESGTERKTESKD